MRTLIATFALLLLGMPVNAPAAEKPTLDQHAYREIAQFLKLSPEVVENQPELAKRIERVVPIGTTKSEALDRLRAYLADPPGSIRVKWELDRDPGAVFTSVEFVDGDRGFCVVIGVIFDSDGKVMRIRTGEFVH